MDNERIKEHPVLTFPLKKEVKFFLEGKEKTGFEGEPVAISLYASGDKIFSHSLRFYRPRGMFCAIGKCSSCMMRVNGIPNTRTCILEVEDKMKVEYQKEGELEENSALSKTVEEPVLIDSDIAIIGAGPAGLSAAYWASKSNFKVILIDQNPKAGGQLIKQTHKFFGSKDEDAGVRGIEISKKFEEEIFKIKNIELLLDTSIFMIEKANLLGLYKNSKGVKIKAKKIIVATGASEKMVVFENNDLPGVFGAGAAQTLMNVYGVKPGNSVLMVGAGNVGLIVAYQLLQAGIEVKAVIDILPSIGGYFVHAAKIRRSEVQILTSHTIIKAIGENHVEGALICPVDKNFNPVLDKAFKLKVDTICLAIGLKPTSEFFYQAGCKMKYSSELGGFVPLRDKDLRTTNPDVFASGDTSGIEEATSAVLEGKIAAISAILDLGFKDKELEIEKNLSIKRLGELRAGPFGEKIRAGIKKVLI